MLMALLTTVGRRTPLALAVSLAFAATACGASRPTLQASEGAAGAATAVVAASAPRLPVTVTDNRGKAVTVTDASRIISLNGDITEIVFALGLGDNVVATDISASFPPAAAALPKVGYQRQLNAEGIVAQRPSVVIGDASAGPPAVIDQLEATGTPVVVIDDAKTLKAPGAKIRAVADALGVGQAGATLADTVDAEIARATARAAGVTTRPRVAFLYVRGANAQLIGGRGSGADAMIAGAGGLDAGTAAGLSDFVPLTPESLVAAAPEVLLVLRHGLESVGGIDGLLSLPGVAQTPAGRDRRVLAYDDLYLLGLGPRTGAALSELIDGLHPELVAGATR